MVGDGADYTLTANDRNAFVALLRAQGDLGPARQSPGQAQFWAFFAAIEALAYDPHVTNALVNGWTDKLFTALLNTKTCYGIDAAGMYVLYSYYQFNVTCWFVGNPCQHVGFPLDWELGGGEPWPDWQDKNDLPVTPWGWFAGIVGIWKPPRLRASLYNALIIDVNVLNDAIKAAGGATSAVAILDGGSGTSPDLDSVQRFEQSRIDPANWTDAGTFVRNLAGTGLWQEQSQAMAALLPQETLTADAYYFLLHLLIALPTGDAKVQALAQQIASASTTSPEYPNDTFVNQLVYLALLYLADPLGPYDWPNAQLQAELDVLGGVVAGQDPASQALRASLAQHKKVLISDAAYPMQDPYTSTGFTQRVTDTLFALDKARAALKQ